MATYVLELRNYKDKKGLQPIVLRITVGKTVSRKNTGIKIEAKHWDAARQRVKRTHPNYTRHNDALDALVEKAEGTYSDALAEGVEVSHASEVRQLAGTVLDFYEVAEKRIEAFRKEDQFGSAARYGAVITKLKDVAPHLSVGGMTTKLL